MQAQTLSHAGSLPTPSEVSHSYLNVSAPTGELFVRSSGVCGAGYWKIIGPDTAMHRQMRIYRNPQHGTLRTVNFHLPGASIPPAAPNAAARLSDQVARIESLTPPPPTRAELRLDPSAHCDLFLDLGMGACRLDLSGLSLENVNIHSVFADIFLGYAQPNQTEMREMEIHAADADVVLKQIELARAQLITVQNDMGDTRVIIGKSRPGTGTLYLRSGMGNCTLILSPQQPLHLTLHRGMLTRIEMPAHLFQEIAPGVFVNAAYQRQPEKAMKIICEVDFGNISVLEGD
jgi:hypothetical protein